MGHGDDLGRRAGERHPPDERGQQGQGRRPGHPPQPGTEDGPSGPAPIALPRSPGRFRNHDGRTTRTSSQAIVNLFSRWYADLGFSGCSSHSGRRTFITNAARKISTVGGSLRDIQMLAGHSNLSTTQRYIESHAEAQRKIVELV